MAAPMTLRAYEQAESEVTREEANKGFRFHAAAYVLVNLFLLAIDGVMIAPTDDAVVWFVFPQVCWGIGRTAPYVFGIRQVEAHIAARQRRIE